VFGPLGGVVWVGVGVLVLGWLALLVWTCRSSDPQWAMAMGCALMVALAPRTGIWEMVIGLLPWFFAWHWASELEQKRWRRAAQALLWILWLAAGLMSYAGYGVLSNVAFGLGLTFALVALPQFRASVLPATFALAKLPSTRPGTLVNALAQGKDGNAGGTT